MTTTTHPNCGGTILTGGAGEQAHIYCDRCHAFTYTSTGETVPGGTDREANRAAWDAGDDRSPADAVQADPTTFSAPEPPQVPLSLWDTDASGRPYVEITADCYVRPHEPRRVGCYVQLAAGDARTPGRYAWYATLDAAIVGGAISPRAVREMSVHVAPQVGSVRVAIPQHVPQIEIAEARRRLLAGELEVVRPDLLQPACLAALRALQAG